MRELNSRGISETAGAVIVILVTIAIMLLVTYSLGVLGEPAPRVRGWISLTLVNTGDDIWSFETLGEIHSSPSTDGERIYFGSNDGRVYALSLSGKSVWSFKTGGPVVCSCLVLENTVYVCSYDGKLYALEKDSGRMRWSFQVEGSLLFPPSSWEDLLFLSSPLTGELYALSAWEGILVWKRSLDSPIVSSPVVWENRIYVGTWEGPQALRAENGELLWFLPTPFPLTAGLHVESGRIYLPVGPYFYCLNAENGERMWHQYLGVSSYTPTLWENRVYVGDEAGVLHCLEAGSGEELWYHRTGGAIVSPPSFREGELHVGSMDGSSYCLDVENGALRGSFRTGGAITSTPLPLENRLYLGSSDHRLYCLNLGELMLVLRWRGERIENAIRLENGKVEWKNLRVRINGKRLDTRRASLNGDTNPGSVSLQDGDLLELFPSSPPKTGDVLMAAYAPADQLLGFWRIETRTS